MRSEKILQGFLYLNISIILFGYLIGFNKSLWLDELLTINHGKELSNLNLKEIFTQNPNALFYFFINYTEKLLKIFNINVDENINLIRAINLIGLIPIILSYKILRAEKIQINIYIVFLLLISNNYFFYYILEIRTYFLLMSFSFLICVLNLTNTLEEKYKYLFIFSSIIISTFHIYGFTISISILFYRLILNFYQKNYFRLKIDFYIIIILLLIFLLIYWLNISNSETLSKYGYLKFHLYYVVNFIGWSFNTVIFLIFTCIFIIFFNIRKSSSIYNFIDYFSNKFYLNILGQIIPIIILIILILLVSLLIMPIIHHRYFIVIYPSLALISGLLGHALFNNNQQRFLLIIFLTMITLVNISFYLKNILNSEQNIKWVVKNTFTKNCKDTQVYFNYDGKNGMQNIVIQMVSIYSDNLRPIRPLSEFDLNDHQMNKKNYENCEVLFFSFHTYNLEENLNELNTSNFKFDIKYAPNVINKDTSKAGAIVLIEKN